MSDRITWTLGADSSAVRAEMTSAVNAVRQAGDQMVQGFSRVDAAHGNLLKSSSRVGHQISNVTRDILSGADASTVFASSLEGIGRSLKLGLGAITSLFVGAIAVDKLHDAVVEVREFNKELDAAAKPRDTTRTTDQIKEQVSKGVELQKKAVVEEQKTWRNFFVDVWHQFFKTSQTPEEKTLSRGGNPNAKAKTGSPIEPVIAADYDKSWSRAMKAGADKKPIIDTDTEIKNKARVAAENDEADKREIARREAEARSKDAAQKKSESMKLSLADLAANGREWAPGMDTRAGAGRLARQAMKEEALARKEMLAEHYDAAGEHQQRADTIKNSITPLRDTEKDFLSAIERAGVFREIAKNTAQRFVNK